MFASEPYQSGEFPGNVSMLPICDLDNNLTASKKGVVEHVTPDPQIRVLNGRRLSLFKLPQILKVRVVRRREAQSRAPDDSKSWSEHRVVISNPLRTTSGIAWAQPAEPPTPRTLDIGSPDVDNSLDFSSPLRECDPPLASANQPNWYLNPGTSERLAEDPSNATSREKQHKSLALHVRTLRIPLEKGNSLAEKKGVFACGAVGCNAVLRSRRALTKHAVVHAEKIHACEVCGSRFAEKTKLRRHMLVHSNERPYKCTFENCEMAFNKAYNLRVHIKTHTGEKPHKCEKCGRQFLHSYNLKVHILRRHSTRLHDFE